MPEINFVMETYYYQDYEHNRISFISFTDKDIICHGNTTFENGSITLSGTTFFEGGSYDYMKTYEIFDENRLVDLFFRKTSNGFVQRHRIEYHR